MSLLPAAWTRTREEEVAAEPVVALIDVGTPPAPGVIAERDAVSSTAAAVPLRPGPSRNGVTPAVAAALRPMLRISPLDLRPPRHYPERLDFLEPAELARDIDQSSLLVGGNTAMPTGLANMSNRSLVILAVGLLLLMGGLFALRFPVFLGDFDQWGFQINCGSGLHSALTQAVIADAAGTHFVDQCRTALAVRRDWTIPLAMAGALLLSALLIRPSRGRSEKLKTVNDAPSPARTHTVQGSTR
jgi:hypothetical protein